MNTRPRAFRLEDRNGSDATGPVSVHGVIIEEDPLDAIDNPAMSVIPVRKKRGGSWFSILICALLVLLALGGGRAAYLTILELAGDSIWLGGIAVAAAVVAVIAALVLLAREIAGVIRERKVERMRRDAIDTLGVGDEKEAEALVAKLADFYQARGFAKAQSKVEALSGQIMAAEDRLIYAERELLAPLDREAKRIVANTAKQVSVVTTLSPRAAIDMIFVVYAAVRMLRQLSRLYGGRPGTWSFFRLLKASFSHLALTGGIAVGDSLLQQVFGLGLAAKISARLGEGALNGLVTARFGLAAISVCRPLPFIGEEPPRLGEVAGELLKKADKEE